MAKEKILSKDAANKITKYMEQHVLNELVVYDSGRVFYFVVQEWSYSEADGNIIDAMTITDVTT